MPATVDDLRFAARTFSKNKGFTAIAVLSLALGIGANAAIFSLVDAVLLKPLPVAQPDRLVALYTRDARNPGSLPLSYPNFLDLRSGCRSFSALVAHRPVNLSLSGLPDGAEPEKLLGELVSGSYFETLGVRPALGRGFLPEEDEVPGARPVAVLTHSFWRRRFGADPAAVGKDVVLNGTRFSIVGVAPADFRGLNALAPPEVFLPVAMYEQAITTRPLKFNERRALHLFAAGRLKPGASLGQAQSEVDVLSAGLAREYPEANTGRSVELVPLVEATINPNLKGKYVLAGTLLMTVAGLVLLVACATVANLLLARAVSRRKEIAIRLSLGAARGRLVRQLLTESLVLAFAGGAAGLLVAVWGRDFLWSLRPPFLPASLDLALDARVLGFTFGLSLATGILFGLLPALQSSRPEVVTALKNQAAPPLRGRRLGMLTTRSLLVVAQVALSLLSLIGAALFIRSLLQAQRIDPGFKPEGLVTLSLDPGGRGYDAARGQELYRRVVEEVEQLPGIRRAAISGLAVLQPGGFQRTLVIEGQEAAAEDSLLVRSNAVGTGYFETMGIPLRRGRGFTPGDSGDSRPVAMINETMVRRFWPGQEPIGRRFGFFGQDEVYEIVGVAADAKYTALGEEPLPYVYLPLLQSYPSAATLYARATDDPAMALAAIRKRVRALDPSLPLTDAGPVSDALDRALWGPRVAAGLLLLFGLLALVLATMGLYGVISYAVQQGRRDIGIRVALGATKGDVLGLVLRQGVTLIALGLSLGLAAAALLTPRLPELLVGTSPSDPAAWAGAAAVLALVGLAATWVPARRAAGIDPALVLRQE
jgi:macrolide transport system ATP-binding/permease protein